VDVDELGFDLVELGFDVDELDLNELDLGLEALSVRIGPRCRRERDLATVGIVR
jgi:hypothetical protein